MLLDSRARTVKGSMYIKKIIFVREFEWHRKFCFSFCNLNWKLKRFFDACQSNQLVQNSLNSRGALYNVTFCIKKIFDKD